MRRSSSSARTVELALAFAAAAVLLVAIAFVWAPDLVVSEGKFTDAAKLEKARNDVRTAAIQFLGVLGLGIGAVLTARTVRVSREGQIIDRFTSAVDQIGNHEALAARVGGVYALEQVARKAPEERAAAAEVLRGVVEAAAPIGSRGEEAPGGGPPPDAQAALSVLGRLDADGDESERPLELRGVDLRCADLQDARLARCRVSSSWLDGASFVDSKLAYAYFSGVHAPGADFWRANLRGARFERSTLQGARLQSRTPLSLIACACEGSCLKFERATGADKSAAIVLVAGGHMSGAVWSQGAELQGAIFLSADLAGINFLGADLTGAELRHALLRGAWLNGVNLSGATLDGADLRGAHASETTRWPEGFDPGAAGIGTPIPDDLHTDEGRRDLRGWFVASADVAALSRMGEIAGADLRGATLMTTIPGLDLSGALLCGATFSTDAVEDVNLAGADLRGARLKGVRLRSVDVRDADLRGASLERADLSDCDLTGVQLTGAGADSETRWPRGVDPAVAGVRITW